VTALGAHGRRTFAALAVRNYRLYFAGQLVSLAGTWMQGVAQAWLVLRITGSGTALGLVTALQFLPVLLFGPVGGLVADRFPKRRTLYFTQAAAGTLSLVLGITVATGAVRLWMVYVLAAGLGCVNTIDLPTRQTFIMEMVGADHLTNAVSLNSVMVNLARVVGPAVAGLLIATVGLATCFLVNSASYLAVLAALVLMRGAELKPAPRQPRQRGQVRAGLRYVRSTPQLLTPLLMMAVMGTLAYEFQVILPLVARFTFHGGARTYGTMSSCLGGGAVLGGLLTASRRGRSATVLARAALVFGVAILAAALAPTMAVELALLVVIGAASISFLALGNTTLQLATAPEMRGRVMSLWTMALVGSTPIGGPVVGWIGEHIGPRYGLAIGGVAAIAAGLLAYRPLARMHLREPDPAEPDDALDEQADVEAATSS
jgi:MFS family permease